MGFFFFVIFSGCLIEQRKEVVNYDKGNKKWNKNV